MVSFELDTTLLEEANVADTQEKLRRKELLEMYSHEPNIEDVQSYESSPRSVRKYESEYDCTFIHTFDLKDKEEMRNSLATRHTICSSTLANNNSRKGSYMSGGLVLKEGIIEAAFEKDVDSTGTFDGRRAVFGTSETSVADIDRVCEDQHSHNTSNKHNEFFISKPIFKGIFLNLCSKTSREHIVRNLQKIGYSIRVDKDLTDRDLLRFRDTICDFHNIPRIALYVLNQNGQIVVSEEGIDLEYLNLKQTS